MSAGHIRDDFTLNNGTAMLYYPSEMSEEDLEFFLEWIALEVKKISRSVRANAAKEKTCQTL